MMADQMTPRVPTTPFPWAWYATRLRLMGPAELAHRTITQGVLLWTLLRHRLGWPTWGAAYDPGVFEFCTARAAQLPELSWWHDLDPGESAALLDGVLPALGHAARWRPDATVWHESPDTGKTWPRVLFALIPYREGNPYGDVRVAWEPSRLQHLVDLALLAESSGSELRDRSMDLLRAQLLSWAEANPAPTGIHYLSVMECALRFIAVCHAVDLVRDRLEPCDPVWRIVVGLADSHASLIARRLSQYSSSGNHTIAEAAALVYAGTLFPELAEARRWQARGLALLERESSRQILADGGGVEQSFRYHRFVVDLVGLVAKLLEHHGETVPVAVRSAFNRGQAFLAAIETSPGQMPAIGDGDDGWALSPALRWPGAAATWTPGLLSLTETGYSVIRSRADQQATLLFDHGPLGLAPCYGHGHADALSVLFRLGAVEVLIDPGTYSYTSDSMWRAYFRGTAAHNTVTVDGLDQAVQESAFMWSRPYGCGVVRQERGADGAVRVLACHDGYAKRAGVTHWRGVVQSPHGWWLVWDHLEGSGAHVLELNWHLGLEPVRKAGWLRLDATGCSLGFSIQGGVITLQHGQTHPVRGWRSQRYGMKEPITTVVAEFHGDLPHEFVTAWWLPGRQPAVDQTMKELSRFQAWVHEARTNPDSRRPG
jgi:hypothetical protein